MSTRTPTAPARRASPDRIAAADSAGPMGQTLRFGRKQLNLSNLQKVLYAEAGFTKGDVIRYYLSIADALLPHLKNRALTLKRYPNGSEGMFFYEKNCPIHRPPWVDTTRVESSRRPEGTNFCLANDAATLAWVANLASLELHTSLAKAKAVTRPTMMVFDLDPGSNVTIIDCCRVAVRMRDVLAGVGLQSFPKTSGGKGLHFYVPLNTPCTFDDTKAFAHTLAEMFERDDPKGITSAMRKDLRHGRVFIDWSQNDEHKTTVCVYSLRARPRPTVSTPVTWQEVEQAIKSGDPRRLVFEAPDVVKRVGALGDLFAPVLSLKQKLPSL